jgi:hypothetical protein
MVGRCLESGSSNERSMTSTLPVQVLVLSATVQFGEVCLVGPEMDRCAADKCSHNVRQRLREGCSGFNRQRRWEDVNCNVN